MTNKPKALMTQYQEGALIGRELQEMMVEYAAEARFDEELALGEAADDVWHEHHHGKD